MRIMHIISVEMDGFRVKALTPFDSAGRDGSSRRPASCSSTPAPCGRAAAPAAVVSEAVVRALEAAAPSGWLSGQAGTL